MFHYRNQKEEILRRTGDGGIEKAESSPCKSRNELFEKKINKTKFHRNETNIVAFVEKFCEFNSRENEIKN